MAYHLPYTCKKELDLQHYQVPHEHYLQLPLLESPKLLQTPGGAVSCNSMAAYGLDMNNNASTLQSSTLTQEDHHIQHLHALYGNSSSNEQGAVDQLTDWRVLDKFVASQLMSREDHVAKENNYSNASASNNNVFHSSDQQTNLIIRHLNNKQEMVPENASTSTSSCQIDLWK
ncbi:hypothetical protein CCACVL1_05705 [Corchorus capsularis]|uniref:Uncharacterized protein n=1 Tax=Corchorus capsularis TaxID=210143 RepID=A0A1R3JJF3_COCAP|nr:hypothetical protein CCACVL1_05705 [Corchorus capsularis]